MQEKKVILFDLDGTLLFTLEDLMDATNYGLEQYGYPKRSLEEVRSFVGNGVAKLMERAIPGGMENKNYDSCLEEFRKYYKEHMEDKTRPYPEIMELLEALKQAGYEMAIVSNKPHGAVLGLRDRFFSDYVNIAFGDQVGKPIKPDPFCVEETLRILGMEKGQAIYVGDSEIDVETAHRAGITCVAASWGFRSIEILKQAEPEYIIDKPLELLQVLEDLQRS